MKMPKYLGLVGIAALLIAFCPLRAQADTIALGFGGPAGNLGTAPADITVGWAFTLSSPVLVTQLGLFDEGNDGLNTSHIVTIWTSTGTQEAQGTVPSGGTGGLTSFRYVSIAPILLPAGSYTIGGFYSTASDRFFVQASSIATASGVTYDGSRLGLGFAFPPGDIGGFANSYFGPNFEFTTVTTPDSGSTWALLLLAVTAVLGLQLLLPRRSEA
jgi:hypothetical protein